MQFRPSPGDVPEPAPQAQPAAVVGLRQAPVSPVAAPPSQPAPITLASPPPQPAQFTPATPQPEQVSPVPPSHPPQPEVHPAAPSLQPGQATPLRPLQPGCKPQLPSPSKLITIRNQAVSRRNFAKLLSVFTFSEKERRVSNIKGR